MRRGAGAGPVLADPNSDRHPSRPRHQEALTTCATHPEEASCPSAYLLSHIHKPRPGAVVTCLPCAACQEAPDRTPTPTTVLACRRQEQGHPPRGVSVRDCRQQMAWVLPYPGIAPQAPGKRTQPSLVSLQQPFTMNHSSWGSAHFLEKGEAESPQMPDSAHSPVISKAARVLVGDSGPAERP